uniref:Ig-like domain-containing protein n=1 Tax=Melopsittacus undulatus TaxID=13146 RepID=A0A8V5GEY8_MELUD
MTPMAPYVSSLLSPPPLQTPPPPPHVFPLVPCSCLDLVPIGCLARGFFPAPVAITWSSDVTGDVIAYPSQWGGSSYSASSLLVVPMAGVGEGSFRCEVKHEVTQSVSTEVIEGGSMGSYGVIWGQWAGGSVLLLCLLEGPGVGGATVTWSADGDWLTSRAEEVTCERCTNGSAARRSALSVSRDQWERGSKFGCAVRANGVEAEVEASILPPSLADLYVHQNSSITCMVSNLPSHKDVGFTWSRDQGTPLDVVAGPIEELPNGLYRMSSSIRICADEWNSGERFSCSIRVPEFQDPIVRSIRKETAPNPRPPSVYLLPPPPDQLSLWESASLTCMATGFIPKDILVTWTHRDRPIDPNGYTLYGPIWDGDGYTLYSQLRVPVSLWDAGDGFACIVGHDGIPMGFIHRSMDKGTGKATAVNVSVVLSEAEVTCY